MGLKPSCAASTRQQELKGDFARICIFEIPTRPGNTKMVAGGREEAISWALILWSEQVSLVDR